MPDPLILALPKGRIAEEVMPLLLKLDINPEAAFFKEGSRQLRFKTSQPNIDLIRVRSFDVATFVALGAAAIGVAGSDVLMEINSPEIYAPLDLGIAKCRLSVAARKDAEKEDLRALSHLRIATKYPETTRRYFAQKGIQAECIKLHGAMELAPALGLCRRIVDLVSSGKTLQENGLVEIEKIADISSYLIINRTAYKTRSTFIIPLIEQFHNAITV